VGFRQFEMSAGLNDSPKFIQALGQIVREALGQAIHSFIPLYNTRGQLAAPEYVAAGLD